MANIKILSWLPIINHWKRNTGNYALSYRPLLVILGNLGGFELPFIAANNLRRRLYHGKLALGTIGRTEEEHEPD